jgi:hypothetical protein
VALPDPATAPEQSELAGAVSLLVRSYLKPGARPLVPRRELSLALEAVTGKPPERLLAVPAELAPKLMERLAVEALVVWQLEVGARGTTVTGSLLGRGGKRTLRISAAAATGDVATLAASLARKLAPAIGATVAADLPDVGMGDLRPLVAAESAVLGGDAAAATRAADAVLPGVAERLPAAKEALLAIAEDGSLPALPRAQARMLRGEWAAAAELADAGLAKEPKHALLRATRVRALAAQSDFAGAEQELAALKGSRNLTAVALAQVALALARGDDQAKKDEAMAPLVGRPASEWRPLLPLIAATPPGTFGQRIEAAALAAAEKLQAHEPGLASSLAARALAGGAGAKATAGMIRVQELSAEQIKALSIRLSAEAADAAAASLSQQIKARQDEAKQIAEEEGPQRPVGPPSSLAQNLLPVLQEFDGLYEPTLSSIQVAPLPGSGEPFYWPFLVRKGNLEDGLLEALARSPWELRAKRAKLDTEALPAERFSDEGLVNLAHDLGASALLLYRIQPAGLAPWVKVELVLHDTARQQTERLEASLVGRSTGLVILNPLMIVLGALALVAALGWAVVISFRGAIQVRVQWDSDAKDELFSILISKTQKTPAIQNLTAYRKKLEWLGRRKRRFEAWNIEQNTTFRGIPRGKWYVHLYGIYTRGRQIMQLHEPPQEAIVQPRKCTFVAHVLEAAEAEFKVKVIDDAGPVEGARVWLDEDRGKAVPTDKNGCVSFKVAKGYRVIHVLAHGMTVEKPYHVVKAKLHEFTINLVWERRQEYVSRALERQVDDAEQYMTKRSTTGSFHAVPPPAAAAPTADPGIVDLVPARPGKVGPPPTAARGASPVPHGAAPAAEAPLDLDMSGEIPLAPEPHKSGR